MPVVAPSWTARWRAWCAPSPKLLLLALAVMTWSLAGCADGQDGRPDPEPPPDDGDAGEDDTAAGADGQAPAPGRAAPLPQPRTEVAGTTWQGQVVVVGGLDDGGDAVARVDVYDPDADAWQTRPELPAALHHTAVAMLGERLYVVGGYTNQDGTWSAESAVYSLGPGEDRWHEEPALGTARGALAVASTGERLVAVGGVNDGQVLTSTETLARGQDEWRPGPELTTPREHLAATAVEEEVYAVAGRVGGLDANHASVEVLRPGGWEPAGELETARGGVGAATVAGMPCVAGGEEPGGTIATVECRRDGRWQVAGELEVARHGLAVAARRGLLHVVGGGTEPGLTVSDTHERLDLSRR